MISSTTKYPVVLIHGVFGYGRIRPLWNLWSPYWPEKALDELNKNHIEVEVGALSSNHDRACETFYQLYGGRVDYGETHSFNAGHNRFGVTYTSPLHPAWSMSNPVHLVGHSFGGTTALELYQLICSDFFKVGSDHRWVVSVISIAAPLTGSTLTHLFGLHTLHMVPFSLGHFIGAILGLWFKLYTEWPVLRDIFDFRMPQWQCVTTFHEVLSPYGRINRSTDLAVFDILPHERMKRNAQLIHMDKTFLVAVITSNHVTIPRVEIALIVLVLVFMATAAIGISRGHIALAVFSMLCSIKILVRLRRLLQDLDFASIPSLYALLLVMRCHVQKLHMIFDGFDRTVWDENDGVVNLYSMQQPWTSAINKPVEALTQGDTKSTLSPSPYLPTHLEPTQLASVPATGSVCLLAGPRFEQKGTSTKAKSQRSDLDPMDPANFSQLRRGVWYHHRVHKNHMAGTHFDSDSPALFQRLFQVMANHFETTP